MNKNLKRVLYWSPRVLSILFAIFISLFALDVIGVGYSFWETVAALLIHLIPTYIVIIVLILAWRWEWIGAFVFIALAFLYFIETGRLDWSLFISGPLILIGTLFLFNWLYRAKLRRL